MDFFNSREQLLFCFAKSDRVPVFKGFVARTLSSFQIFEKWTALVST